MPGRPKCWAIAHSAKAICETRPPNTATHGAPGRDRGRKKGLYEQIAAEVAAEVERLAAVAVDSLGPSGAGLAAVELAIRTAMSRLGASLLQQLLATDTGHRGPRIDCGAGHHAAFVGYHDKNLDTVLGRVVVRRAYYHCASCGRGVVPRDDELGVAGASLSPGLRKITARAAATAPFAQAADLLADLAGIRLNPKRIERSAEADGGDAAARLDHGIGRDRAPAGGRAAHHRARRAGQALHRRRRHRRAHGGRRHHRARRQGTRRARPHPRGQTRRPVHPDQDRRRRATGP